MITLIHFHRSADRSVPSPSLPNTSSNSPSSSDGSGGISAAPTTVSFEGALLLEPEQLELGLGLANREKAGRSMHLTDMARYLDAQHQKATAENDKPHDRAIRKAG